MDTRYAPAEKDSIDLVKKDFHFLSNIVYIEKLINSLPYFGAILNDKRQIVFANHSLLDMFELSNIENILGFRAGEVLNCVNADPVTGGCGTSVNCSACGAVNCILEAQKRNQKIVSECRISSHKNGDPKSYDFKVTTTPFEWNDKKYYVFSLVDIGDEKRRKMLEKIFFHDVINKTGSMNGFIDLLKIEKDPERIGQFINFLDTINKDLTEEILSQRELLSAENSELKIKPIKINTKDILETSAVQISRHEAATEKEIIIDSKAQSETLVTDEVILKRILMNMLKNALEASSPGENVIMGFSRFDNQNRFWVKNNAVMPDDVKMQIFQRSFSTKSVNRGLGTYSIKLLGEKYLKGKVGFISSETEQTVFYIDLPEVIK